MLLLPGSIIAGKFRLERPLAQGGMGAVWVAFNTQLEVPVALKFMAPALVGSAELVARFEREAKAAAQLRNPHVVQIFEHGVDQGMPFIAMELLEGEDLGGRLRALGRLSLQETARILGDVCKALRRAHDMGIVHRDLKPANVFLCKHDEYEIVKVLDFGIAKSASATARGEGTKTGSLVGSPHYMSPEQARRTNKQVDHRTDLWAIGVIAFRCLTGQLPYPGDDVIDVLVRVCTDPVPIPSSIAPDLGAEIDRFFVRALAREPEGRFQSAKEMADALSALAGSPRREGTAGLERSWSDVNVPPPRASDPAAVKGLAARAPVPEGAGVEAARGGANEAVTDVLDTAKTLPLAHPAAQRALEGRPWAASLEAQAQAPTPVPVPIEVAAPPLAASGSPGPTPGFGAPGAVAAVVTLPLPTSAPAFVPPGQGTLTSAGAELAASSRVAAGRERPWIAPAIAGAAILVVVVMIAAVVVPGRSGDEPAGAAMTGEALPGATTGDVLPGAVTSDVLPGATTGAPTSAAPLASSSEPSSGVAAATAASTSASAPSSATVADKPAASSRATVTATPAVSTTPAATAPTSKPKVASPRPTSSSGYLKPAKF